MPHAGLLRTWFSPKESSGRDARGLVVLWMAATHRELGLRVAAKCAPAKTRQTLTGRPQKRFDTAAHAQHQFRCGARPQQKIYLLGLIAVTAVMPLSDADAARALDAWLQEHVGSAERQASSARRQS